VAVDASREAATHQRARAHEDARACFVRKNALAVLAKVVSLPVTRWNYKAERGVSRIGPMGRVSENAALRTQLDAVKRAVAQLVSASSRVAMRSTCDHRALSPVFLPIPISKWTFKGADRSLPAGVDRRKTVSTPAY
jgi:hypothetical protein